MASQVKQKPDIAKRASLPKPRFISFTGLA